MYGQDLSDSETPQQVSIAPNPNYRGIRVVDRDDLFPRGFTKVELDAIYAGLTQDIHDEGLILESPGLADVEFYNPGVEPVSDDFILEAIIVEHFSRTERRMTAVVKVLNRHLKDSEITALSPVVGKPRKSGSFAYVIVQLPFSDGQTVNVVFHSPEGDKKKITANDTIIAFRWLLNKRDITHVVAPEDGEEVSLETIAKRVTQLVVKNSARFERQQKAAQAELKELETTREAVKEAEGRQTELMDKVAGVAKEAESIEARLSNTLAQLEKQRTLNAELQAKIDALRAQRGQTGSGTGDSEPMVRARELGDQATSAAKKNSDEDTVPSQSSDPTSSGSQEPPGKGDSMPDYMQPIQAILDGAYDTDTGRILDLLEKAIEAAEKDGNLEPYQPLLDAASNRLTELLAKEAV